MSDETKKLSPGDRWQPSAEALNGYQEAADFVRDQRAGGGALPFAQNAPPVTVKNKTSSNLARFSILGIDKPIISPADNEEVFKSRVGLSGISPAMPDHLQHFVVLSRPLAAGALGPAIQCGVVPVMLKVVSESHKYARVDAGETSHLISDCIGYPILWTDNEDNADDDGYRWALVGIGGPANLLCEFELKTDKSPGNSASAYYLKPVAEYSTDRTIDSDADTFVVYDQEAGRQWRAIGRDTLISDETTGRNGARGIAAYNCVTSRFEIVQMQEQAKKLSGKLSADSFNNFNIAVNTLSASDGGQIPVIASNSSYSVSAAIPTNWGGFKDSSVELEWVESSAAYKIVSDNQQSRMIMGCLSAALSGGSISESTTLTYSSLFGSPAAMDGLTLPTNYPTVYNPFKFKADAGALCVAVQNGSLGWGAFGIGTNYYIIIQVVCPA